MAKKRTGKKTQKAYEVEGRYAKNKKAKLERHMKNHPNDLQAKGAVNNVKQYSRKAPHNNMTWTPFTKWYAETLRKVGYNGNVGLR